MPSPKSAGFPSAAQAALLFVALFLCEVVMAAALRDANGWLGLNTLQIGVLSAVLGNGCVFAVVMHRQQLSYRQLFHPSASSAGAMLMLVVPPVLLLVPALLLVLTGAMQLLALLVPPSGWEAAYFSRMADGSVAAVLAVCVMAPLLEEMLFRGIVLRGFLQRYARWQAIFLSALLFGAAHMNIYQFVVGFAMGCVLGWLYERTRSLIPCIVLHAAYNGATLLLADRLDALTPSRLLGAAAVALAAGAFGLLALRAMLLPGRRRT